MVQEQKQGVTALREELDNSETELQLTNNKGDEMQETTADILIRDQKYIHALSEDSQL